MSGESWYRNEPGAPSHSQGGSTRDAGTQGFDRDRAEREARDAISNARQELQSLLESQKNTIADQVRDVAEALRHTADDLKSRDQANLSTYVAHVAERVDSWAGHLRQRHVDSLVYDIQELARRQPGLFIAGAVLVGFAATRFLKSTADDRTARDDASVSSTNTPGRDGDPGARSLSSAGPSVGGPDDRPRQNTTSPDRPTSFDTASY